MANRRQVIQGSAVVSLAAAAGVLSVTAPGSSAAVPSAPPGAAMCFYKVLFERTAAAGRLFGAEAARSGAAGHPIEGNVTAICRDELLPLWQHTPAAVAGLTEYHNLFVLDLMAHSAGLRTVYIGYHEPSGAGNWSHRLFGPRTLATAHLDASEAHWARQAAALLMSLPAALAVDPQHSNVLDARLHSVPQRALVSWVIAPRRLA